MPTSFHSFANLDEALAGIFVVPLFDPTTTVLFETIPIHVLLPFIALATSGLILIGLLALKIRVFPTLSPKAHRFYKRGGICPVSFVLGS
jgi:hypothetical protein